MKKFFINLIYGVVFSLLLVTGIFSYTAINKANAVDTQSETTHTVNFYAEDNETILYSVNVPNGMSLQDLQDNNLLKNSDFSSYTQTSFNINSTRQLFANDWYIYSDNGSNSTITNSQNGFTFDYVNFSVAYQIGFTSYVPGETLYLTTKVNDNIFNSSLVFSDTFTTYLYFSPTGSNFAFAVWTSSSTYLSNLDMRFNRDITMEYISVGYQNLPYFNSAYVKKLYINNGGNVGSNFEWSESPTSSSRFNFDIPITKDINLYGYNFNGQTINYTGEVTTDYGNLGNYAIKDIEFLQVDGNLLYHVIIDTDKFTYSDNYLFYIFGFRGTVTSSNAVVDTVVLDSDDDDVFNFFIYSEISTSTSSGSRTGALELDSTGSVLQLLLNQNHGLVHVYFSNAHFEFVSRSDFNLLTNDGDSYSMRITDNLNSIVDMSSDTNFDFSVDPFFGISDTSSFKYRLIDSFISGSFENDGYLQIQAHSSFGSDNYNYDFFIYQNGSGSLQPFAGLYTSTFIIALESNVTDISSLVNYYVKDFFFFVHRPVQRVDNTLVIYNFDYYNLLYYTDFVSYQLQADGNLYNVNYSGDIPNSYFVYVYNNDVINTLFDEYVYVYLNFDNSILLFDKKSDNNFYTNIGFDFNFTYYIQPLVSNSGVYSYTFDKPDYVSMLTSTPPFFDILAAAENILIFFMFYCPVISDLIALLNFDLFFGSLIKIFDIFVASGIGDFILSCFAFLIFWSILKGMFPSLISSSSGWSNFAVMDEVQDTVAYVHGENKKRKYKQTHKLKPYHHKSTLKSKSRKRRNNLRALTNNDSNLKYRRKYVKNVIDDLDNIDI